MGIQKILIVGSGLMGSGIAQVCAQAGLDVLLSDVSHEALEKALKNIEWSVGKLVDKGNTVVVWEQNNGTTDQIFMSEYRNGSWTCIPVPSVSTAW